MESFISIFRFHNNLELVHNFIILRLRANQELSFERLMAVLEVVSTSVVVNPVFQSSSSSSD